MASAQTTAAAAGTWTLGDLTVNRMGFGAMRLPQTGRALTAGAVPGGRDRAVAPVVCVQNRYGIGATPEALRLSPDEMACLGALRW